MTMNNGVDQAIAELKEVVNNEITLTLEKSIEFKNIKKENKFLSNWLSQFLEDFRVRFEEGEIKDAKNCGMAIFYCAAARHMKKVYGMDNHIADDVQKWIDEL